MSIYGSYEDMRDFQRGEEDPEYWNKPKSHVFIPGEDFDPYDEDDVAAVKQVMEKDAAAQIDYWRERALRAERAAERRWDEEEED